MQVTIEEIDLLRDMLGELRDKDLLSSYANDLYQILLKKVSIKTYNLFYESYDDLPLYINDTVYSMRGYIYPLRTVISMWRLKIGR